MGHMVAQIFSKDKQVPRSLMYAFVIFDAWCTFNMQSVSLPGCLVSHLVWMMYYVTTVGWDPHTVDI